MKKSEKQALNTKTMVNFHETCSFQTQQKLPIERFWKNSALVWLIDSRVVR